MDLSLQKASLWKRIGAGLLDMILLCCVAVGFASLLSWALGYDAHHDALYAGYEKYETAYGVVFDITAEEYEAMEPEARANYDAAYEALIADDGVMKEYNLVINLTLIITTFGILLGYVALEWIVPLLLKNGQTLGKKCFALGLMRTDGVKLSNMQFFVRTILGKFTIETMVPVYLIIMILFGTLGFTGTLVIGLLGLTQIICMAVTRTNSLIHDLLAATVVVDLPSQRIFDSTEALIAYKKQLAADEAAKRPY